jgi:excisionase family DNA binding protein
MPDAAYLTVKEAALDLGITEDGVRKLIRREKLRAVKRSERNTLIPRPAFDAYLRKINGAAIPPIGRAVTGDTLDERLAAFEGETGKSPEVWLAEWIASGSDIAVKMELAVSAAGLLAEQRLGLDGEPRHQPSRYLSTANTRR